MWSTFWITLERRIHLIFMVANFLLMAYHRVRCNGMADTTQYIFIAPAQGKKLAFTVNVPRIRLYAALHNGCQKWSNDCNFTLFLN